MTDAQFSAWLQSPSAIRMVLVEAQVNVAGTELTRYLASRPFVTGPTEAPANIEYEPVIVGGISLTEQVSLTSEASLSSGDIELSNVDGTLDGWLDDVWANRPIRAWVGDPRWPRAQFRPIFTGIIADIASASRDSVNIKLRDKRQRLNTPVSERLLGGATANKGSLIPLLFGEAHNVTPLLTDPATQEYQFHDGEVELGLEVRTSGKPRDIDFYPERGSFRFREAAGSGAVTVSAHGAKYQGQYVNTISKLVQCLVTMYGNVANRFIGPSVLLAAGSYSYGATDLYSFARASAATYTGADGSIQAAAVNSPRIDYSTGAGQLLVEGAATNLLRFSEQADNALFTKFMLSTTVANAALAPDGTMTADRIVENTALGRHGNEQTIAAASLLPSTWYAWSRFYKAAERSVVWSTVGSFASQSQTTGVYLNLLTGQLTGTGAARATVQQYPNGWWRLTVTCQTNSAPGSVTPGSYLADGQNSNSYQGDGTSGVYVWGGQFEALPASGPASSYIPTTTAIATRAADVAYYSNDLDSANLAAFDAANPQPVGLALTERTNVLEACQRLASSLGAQLTISRAGRLRLLQLRLPGLAASTAQITPDHMRDRTMRPASRQEVQAAVKLGFCRNYTVQEDLQTSLPTEHKELYAKEWLTTEPAVNTVVRDLYRLDTEPTQIDTCLLRRVDANAEAARQLALRSTSLTVYEFDGEPEMLMLDLGQDVTVTYPRFGMAAGVPAVVVSLAPDWLTGRCIVGVLA